MKRLLSALLLLLMVVTTASAQYAIGSWRQHRAYGNATDLVVADGLVFGLASGNIYAYNPVTTEVQTFDTQSGLSGNGISYIDYDATTHTVIVAYADCTIDLIDSRTLDITGLTSLRDKDLSSKTINGIAVSDGTAWLCMSFGLIEVNLAERHFGETYDLQRNVVSCTVCGDELFYCARGAGMYRVSLDDNLHDSEAHKRLGGNVYDKMLAMGTSIYCLATTSFDCFDVSNNGFRGKVLDNNKLKSMHMADRCIVAYNDSRIVVIDEEGKPTTIMQPNDFVSLVRKGNTFWASRGLNGLQPYKLQDDALVEAGSAVIPNSPRYDYFYRMHYVGERLLVAGGAHEYGGKEEYEGMAAYYENGTWTNLDTVVTGREKYINITGIAQHPANPQRHYLTSRGHGLYVYENGHLSVRYNHTNSPLATILPDDYHPEDYVRVNAPTFDATGNLWMLNGQVDTLLWCLSPQGKWSGYYFPEIEGSRCPDGIHFDGMGRIWLLLRDMAGRGIFCYDPSTRQHRLRGSITQQDGLSYHPDNFFCCTPDRDGALWVGTEQGLFVISDPLNFFASDFTWTQIKVNREDGSGLADYMLGGAYVSTIAVDGGNRKWIGTVGSGVYLVSADGQEMLQHFTTDNSPLPSDNIRSIAVNPVTGEVMIGTEGGLASYMGDATEPELSLDEDNIEIFPNPVRPEFSGSVTIRGLVSDCEVKIATVTGQVVWSGESVGGTATWDLQKRAGGRVATGIYNVILNNSDGKDVVVARLAVIK